MLKSPGLNRKQHGIQLLQRGDSYRYFGNVKALKSNRLRWAGHVARTGETRNEYRILIEKSL
jgi:hypothetical protein